MTLEHKVSSSEDTLLLLKQLVETEAPLIVIRAVIARACERLDPTNRSEPQARQLPTSDMYLG